MNLFDIIPEKFFSILASPNRVLYYDALLVARELCVEDLNIRKKDLINRIAESLNNEIEEASFEEEEMEYGKADSAYDKALIIFNKLKSSGWLETEFTKENKFEEMVTLPDFAIKIITLLFELTQESTKEYKSFVFATYSVLKESEKTQGYVYTALLTAYERTESFLRELTIVYNNIKRYHKRVGSQEINELLVDHFEHYQKEVMKIIEPIKTNDSVGRFKNPILQILETWREDDKKIGLLIEEGMKEVGRYKDEAECKEDVINMIDYIIHAYSTVERLIRRVESKHNNYVVASTERIKYKINNTQDIKGSIASLIEKAIVDEETLTYMESVLPLYQVTALDSSSLYKRVNRNKREFSKAEPIIRYNPKADLKENFLAEIRALYSSDKIDSFVLSNLKNGAKDTRDFAIDSNEDYILFLLSTIRESEKDSPYKIERCFDTVEKERFRLPLIKYFMRGEK